MEVIEAEHGHGSLQENAPFKITYFAHVKKGSGSPKSLYSHHKQEDVEVEAHGKTYKATLVETTHEHGGASRSRDTAAPMPQAVFRQNSIFLAHP